jgi:hypothetical protein
VLGDLPNAAGGGDRLDVGDVTDKLEVHPDGILARSQDTSSHGLGEAVSVADAAKAAIAKLQ